MGRSKGAATGGPWYDKRKDVWKVTVGKRSVTVKTEFGYAVKGEDNQAAAIAAALRRGLVGPGGPTGPIIGPAVRVATVLSRYLEESRERLSQSTLDTYQGIFDALDEEHGHVVAVLFHSDTFKRWLERRTTWGPSTRHLAGSSVKAAFAWAAARGRGRLIESDPLQGMRLPTVRRRSHATVVSQKEFDSFLAVVYSDALRDIMSVAWETGTRPVNLARAVVGDYRPSVSALVLDKHKVATRTGRPLIVPLTGKARAVLDKLVVGKAHDQLVFRTPKGLPWTKTRLACLVLYYARKVGLQGRLSAYSCRHSLATRLLLDGVPDVDVAAILGNTPAVLHRHYSHVAADSERLRRILER